MNVIEYSAHREDGPIELSNNECLGVSGGMAFLPAIAVGVAGFALFSAAEKAGESMGRAFYKATH
jgi:hypothetical protein